MLKRIILFLTIATCCLTQASAATVGSTFYYKFIAQAATTGEGKVYVSNKDEKPAEDRYFEYYGTSTLSQACELNVAATTVTAFLFAKPADGYLFTHWTRIYDN